MVLSSKSLKEVKDVVKEVNKGIRAEHNAMKKKVLDKIRAERKVEIKDARVKLNEMLKKKLIPIGRRKKEELIGDLNKHKKHWPEELKEPPKKFVSRMIGGKLRRIPVDNLKKAEERKKEKKAKVPKITITEAEETEDKKEKEIKSQLPPLKEKPRKIKLPKAAKPKASELKQLKKLLKEKGVSGFELKLIKTVDRAKEKLDELEEDKKTSGVEVASDFLKMVSSKDRAKVTELVKIVLPRDEYSIADQKDYLETLKDMADDWPNSASPRIKYNDQFDASEKELFDLLFPGLVKKEVEEKPKKKKAKK